MNRAKAQRLAAKAVKRRFPSRNAHAISAAIVKLWGDAYFEGFMAGFESGHESRLKAKDWRYTAKHQKKFFAGDTGIADAAALDSIKINWGGKRRRITTRAQALKIAERNLRARRRTK